MYRCTIDCYDEYRCALEFNSKWRIGLVYVFVDGNR